ncbi:calcitonin gene-related peptide type 1 receptor-like [Cydia pomonella]|uniref:calcitonin gene-related peptide type 1 receptor-like n=1 Tax=Cydia pomonella TaxID=82600 RepID=UPI002ADE58A0|nr:calcitonin gene-related peptide type 1 receptor-like [Cydia pomonella]
MQDSNRTIDSGDPKLQWITKLVEECYFGNVNHSTIFTSTTKINQDEGPWCPAMFDGFACWDPTPASAIAKQRCPEFVIGFDPRRYVFKRCTENGTWYMRPEDKKPWTNYNTCVDLEDLDFRSIVNDVYVAGYSLSVAALILSLMIFFYFRSLRCTRIRIHMHLFTSFALNNILWVVWYKTVVNEVDVVRNNEEWCQVLHIVTNYFMVTSYLWMFCEGLHLHIALVVVFIKDEVAMRGFVALGWGLSLVIVAAYATARYLTPGATDRCWMDQSDTFWIIVVPVLASLISSFVFLVNVVRVLLTKLAPTPNQQARLAARKAARAALILIPLFGLHFVLIPLHPSPGAAGEKVYQVFSALLTSLQGLCVSFLFCFTNHDVMVAVRTQVSRVVRANDAIALTGLTAGESLANTRENVV